MLIYVDTNIWIYAYENNPAFGELARFTLARVRARRHTLAGSLYVLSELLVLPTRSKNEFAITTYKRLFFAKQVQLLQYNAANIGTYADLRAFNRLKPIDALHVATALHAAVDVLLTEDIGLLSQRGIGPMQIMNLETLDQRL